MKRMVLSAFIINAIFFVGMIMAFAWTSLLLPKPRANQVVEAQLAELRNMNSPQINDIAVKSALGLEKTYTDGRHLFFCAMTILCSAVGVNALAFGLLYKFGKWSQAMGNG